MINYTHYLDFINHFPNKKKSKIHTEVIAPLLEKLQNRITISVRTITKLNGGNEM